MASRVCVINTGGTISMADGPSGYAPRPGYLAEQIGRLPEFAATDMPELTIIERDPLIDSADLTPADWVAIGRDVARLHDDFDGFVVVHGTDTMAYTASALSFILRDLDRPVIVTGSQIPLFRSRTDGRDNLVAAIQLAACGAVPEVGLFFGRQLLRGNRATKTDSRGFDAFASPNLPPLATAGTELHIAHDLVRRPEPGSRLDAREVDESYVAALRLFPGISARVLDNVLRAPLQGLVLETYGTGNGPAADTGFLRALERAAENGIVVVNVTQCLRGGVLPDTYATGTALSRAGVVSGHDLTTEAALAKLAVLFGSGHTAGQVRALIGTDLAGELTPTASAAQACERPATKD